MCFVILLAVLPVHGEREGFEEGVAFKGKGEDDRWLLHRSRVELGIGDEHANGAIEVDPFLGHDHCAKHGLHIFEWHFLAHHLANFGDTQDAMLMDDPFLHHAVISMYINIGLLDPLHVCQRVEQEFVEGRAPLNAVEGFIRQVIGWREFVRGIYFLSGPDYTTGNALGHTADLPALYWGGETKMTCLDQAVSQTRDNAYAHHIQRLMVTGNFALLAGVDPHQVHEWYLAVYADAFEWVEAPNTIGMSQFADGGVVGSKPYISSGAYINKMSDYCGQCAYKVKDREGDMACPFNSLYWHFLVRNDQQFRKNPRMAQMYRVWDKMADDRKDATLERAETLLDRLKSGCVV